MEIWNWIEKLLLNNKKRSIPDLRPSFSLSHKGGEIWISCIDNLGNNTELIRQKIIENEEAIKHSSRLYRVLYHLDGTDVNNRAAELIVESVVGLSSNIYI